jgi:cytochrome bd-type quinol oxidase subunit 1
MNDTYSIKIGWTMGLEIMALYFAFLSLILYALIFIAKKRPESKSRSREKQQTELNGTNITS